MNLFSGFKKGFPELYDSLIIYFTKRLKARGLLKDLYDAKILKLTKERKRRRANRHSRIQHYRKIYDDILLELEAEPKITKNQSYHSPVILLQDKIQMER